MRKDFGLYLCVVSCFIVLILTWNDHRGYSSMLSDWENKKCDWATNATVYKYISGDSVRFYRTAYMQKFINELIEKKELSVGIDYYALMYVCKDMIPVKIIQERGAELSQGKVFVYTVTLEDTLMYWREQ